MPNITPPSYIRTPRPLKTSAISRIIAHTLQLPVQLFIWLFLSPRRGDVGNLTPAEVMEVYDREARRYDAKHHFTTRGQDTTWRREAAWCVVNRARTLNRRVQVLDLCTGTGLTVREIVRLLNLWDLKSEITGADLNGEMLRVAVQRKSNQSLLGQHVHFTRADVTQTHDLPSCMDIVTQVFGIGGIPNPTAVFRATLEVLNEGGEYYLVDMHRPIAELPAEVPFLWRWWLVPTLEATTYFKTTIPLALARLWGWRDTTLDFYQAPLTTLCQNGVWYGFETLWFKYEPERWWFGLPVMPTARLLVRKVRISHEEALRRISLLAELENLPT